MMIRLAVAALFALVALAAACEDGGPSEPLTTGIEGQVLIGPQCPVVVEGTPCPDAPLAADVEVWNAERTERVTWFSSNKDDGLFRVELPPGDYWLEPLAQKDGVPPAAEGQQVTVPDQGFVEVTISYDSGIR
jgi:hypothetical protein